MAHSSATRFFFLSFFNVIRVNPGHLFASHTQYYMVRLWHQSFNRSPTNGCLDCLQLLQIKLYWMYLYTRFGRIHL